MIHYTYRITNNITKKHYYGTRGALIPKEDLGIKYFSSSSDKEFIQDQKDNPQNYKYKIVFIFDNREDAIKMEIKLHNKFNVGINESFYNKSKQTSTGFDRSGCKLTINHKKLISPLGRKLSKETKNKIGKGNLNKLVSNKTKQRQSNYHKNRPISHNTNISKNKKENKVWSGIHNPKAKTILIYDNLNNIRFICKGNFIKLCKENDLPFKALNKSRNSSNGIYTSNYGKSWAKNNKKEKYIGWYARDEEIFE